MINKGSIKITEGIKIEVTPIFVGVEKFVQNRFLFEYTIVISNVGDKWAKLLERHWVIIDSEGISSEVRGEGVVGYFPELNPGESFKYKSFCPINTKWGTMEGSFQMIRNNGELFDVEVGRFYLISE